MKRTIILLLAMLSIFALRVNAQLSITAVDTEFTIDFDNTVAGINASVFTGTGFTTAPANGQLNADGWAVVGMSDGDKPFGTPFTTGDYARGASTGAVTTGGIYAFEVEAGNVALGVQPSGPDFTPGWIAFKITNNTGQTVNYDAFSYDVWVYNDQNWSSSFNGEFSINGTDWSPADGFEITTPEVLDASPVWVKTTLSFEGFLGFDLADGQTIYFRLYSNDITGSGSRDEIAIDNISMTFSYKTIITAFPFTENFDALIVPNIHTDWTELDVDGVGSYWESTFSESHSAANSMFHEYSSTVYQDGWLFTPAFEIPAGNPYRLKFWSYNDYPGDYVKNSVLVSNISTNPDDFIEIWSPASVTDSWEETKLDLSAYSGQTIFIAFRYEGYNAHDWYLDDVVIEEAPSETVDWCNLQWPDVGNVETNVNYNVYARVYEPGVTEAGGQGAGIECWIGYSDTNSDPSTWTNWVPATYNVDDGNNDEYMASLTFIASGTYYYASRFSYNDGPYSYGGYNVGGGNFWDGADYISGEVTVTAPMGADCSNPIVVSLPTASPYSDLAQTNCGLGNFYENTCLGVYDSGEDIIYRLDITELSMVTIEMTTAVSWTGIALIDNCPDVGTCLDYSTLSGAGTHTLEYALEPGSYYLMADTWASPDCISSFDLTITAETDVCFSPTDLLVTDITTNSANLQWTQLGTATTWNIKGSSTPIDPAMDPGEFNTSTSDNPYFLTGAPTGTTLYWYVQADCGGGDFSEWSVQGEFTTECEVISAFPWTENFEGISTPDLPACWSEIDNNDDYEIWMTYVDYGVGSSKAAGLYTDWHDGDNDDYLILPTFDLTGNEQLKFFVRARSTGEPNDYRVVLSTTGNSPTDFTEELVPLTTVNWTTMTETSPINLSAYSGVVYIAIHVPSGGLDGWYIYFDNFTIDEIPACPTPIDLFVTDITSNSATLNWTEFGTATSWNIKGSDTPIDPAVDPGTFFTNTNDNPFFATGLPAGTTLYWYVQADCGGDVSEWSEENSFNTQCDPFTIFPYFEGFEDTNMPMCWTVLNEDGDDEEWMTSDDDSYEGDQSTMVWFNASGNDDWLISPQFAINSDDLILEFYAKSGGTTYLEDYNVLISTTGIDPTDFTIVLENVLSAPNSWELKSYKLSDFGITSGQNINVAIQCVSVDELYLFVDAFTVRELSDENEILTFSFPQQTGEATIDPILHTVNVEVAMGTNPNGLIPTFTISDYATVDFESGIEQDFSSPFIYTVTSESGIDQEWTVYVTVATTLSNANDILTFTLTQQTGPADIDNVEHTVDIEVTWDTDRSALTPVITVSALATIDPESGTEQDFTNPFVYTVTAEDLSTQEWTVTVTNAPIPEGATCANAFDYGTINDPEVSGVMTDYSPVWYRFTITETYENVDIHTCGSNFDTKVAVFDDCGVVVNIPEYGQPTGSIGYNDDAIGTYCSIDNNQSLVEFATLDAGTYYVVVYPYDLSTTPDLWALEIIGSLPVTPELNVIDLYGAVEDIEVCFGTIEVDAIAELVDEITITNTDDEEFIVAVTWTIDSYDPITPGDYNATGTFELPAGVAQTDPATDLEVYAVVTVNALPVVTCPADFDVITIDPVTLSGATPIGGEYAGTGVSGGVFDPEGLPLGGYTITYTYTDPVTGCTNDCWFVINLDIPYPELTGIDIYDVVDDVEVCLGTDEADALALLGGQITIENANSEEYNVTLSWSIASYDGNLAGDYNATGTFTLPAGISQTDPVTPLEVHAVVTVNELPVVTCPADDEVTTLDPVTLNNATPEGGNYSGTGVSGGVFDPDGLANGDYTITYTYTDPLTGCSNFCEFVLTLNIPIPEIAEIDINDDVVDVEVCLGAEEADALALLTTQITITDSEDNEYLVDVSWTIDAFNGNAAADYDATGTFELPTGVVQTDPETVLEVYAVVTVNELPVVECPDNFSVTTEDVVTLSGATPAGGTYSGTGVTAGNFDPSALANGDYVITYTYTDPTTGCTNSCEFTITVDIDNNVITENAAAISVYPNPNNGLFNLNFSNVNGNVNYQIYDTKGSIIVNEKLFSNGNTVLEVSLDITPGVYYVKIITETQTLVEKLVIE